MAIEIPKDKHKLLMASIRRYFAENLDEDIGDLKAALLLEFCIREIGPTIYNQAIADAQAWFLEKVGDLDGSLYEAEFRYWDERSRRDGRDS